MCRQVSGAEKCGYMVFAQLEMTLEHSPGQKEHLDSFMRKDLKPAAR